MKRFAVILIIAILAIGCVFAVSSQKPNTNAVTSGDKVIVTTDIDVVYPVYMINASNGSTSKDAAASSFPEIDAIKVYNDAHELTNVQINIALRHFGYQNNEVDGSKMTYIRYAKNVKVTIEAKQLLNESDEDNHIKSSENPTITKNATIEDSADFTASNDVTGGNKLVVTASYITGKRVGNATFDQVISTCTFDWNVLDLTAGDTYKADIVVTYEDV